MPLETWSNGSFGEESADEWISLRAQHLLCIRVCSMTIILLFPDAVASDYVSTRGIFQPLIQELETEYERIWASLTLKWEKKSNN